MKDEEKKREKLSPEKQKKKNERRRKGVDVCLEQMEIHLLSCIKFFLMLLAIDSLLKIAIPFSVSGFLPCLAQFLIVVQF